MSLKKFEIIVIDDDKQKEICAGLRKGLKEAGFTQFKGLPVEVKGFEEAKRAIEYLESVDWRNVKTILIDYILRNPRNSAELQELRGVDLVNAITKRNSSIDIYGMSVRDPITSRNLEDAELQKFRGHTAVKDILDKTVFYKGRVVDAITQVFINPLLEKVKTPFYSPFKEYVKSSTRSFHVPGHNRGLALLHSKFGEDFYHFFGANAFKSDHAVPKSFGSIFNKNTKDNPISESQELAAKTFNTKKTYFITNGNSASNNIILLSLLKPGDRVLVARNCHKSIHYAMIMAGARPTYLSSVFSKKYEIMAPPSIKDIEKKLKEAYEQGKPFKLMVVTGCSYEGLVMDINRLNKLCKRYGSELFVDEAWYGYSNFHHQYQATSATRLGVPYVTQSAHKMLSAFRQSAFIHINKEDNELDEDFLKDIYNTFTSTSPQYQLIASMDVAAMQMRIEGHELIEEALKRAKLLREDFKKRGFKKIKLVREEDYKDEFASLGFNFDEEGIMLDPLKIAFDITKLGRDVIDVFKQVTEHAGVDLIKYTKTCIQILFTIGTPFDRNKPAKLISTLKRLEDSTKDLPHLKESITPKINALSFDTLLPRDYFYAPRKNMDIEDKEIIGTISSTLVTPYPPGIPILLPGEEISESHIEYLKQIVNLGHIAVHGLRDNKIYVYDKKQG